MRVRQLVGVASLVRSRACALFFFCCLETVEGRKNAGNVQELVEFSGDRQHKAFEG